ncbi:MAG: tRNA guanosine(34) transglycosylase Tgt [Bacteroidota bacterium]
MKFELIHNEKKARVGKIFTDNGEIETPIFMPVGTQGSVKAVSPRSLNKIQAQIILGNTYHLYLRPGVEVLQKFGGLHKFMNWQKPILTDSGGYQVFSLSDLRKIQNEGVEFSSHLDGSKHFFTPTKVVEIQRAIGSDIMMVLDECAPFGADFSYVKKSNELTIKWAKESFEAFQNTTQLYNHSQAIFGIVQGSVFKEIRKISAEELTKINFDGFAIGGLAVGEEAETMYDITNFTEEFLPKNKPRYLMGVGTPENLLESIALGIDMFDCVMPTRNARNSLLFTRSGKLNLLNAKFKFDTNPVDEECDCYLCKNFSRGYLRHLFMAKEILALELASVHNLNFYLWLMRTAREKILHNSFYKWKDEIILQMNENKK